jgi:hypothetical protein
MALLEEERGIEKEKEEGKGGFWFRVLTSAPTHRFAIL